MWKFIHILIFLSTATLTLVKAYDKEKVSCKVTLNEDFGRVCRLENVNLQTMKRLEVDGKSFKYVFFQDSNFEFFTDELVKQLERIEYLNVNEVGLEHIDGNFLGKLNELIIFWGSKNEIEALDEGAFSDNINLEMICLKFNKIKFIHQNAFNGLEKLLKLDLSSNKIKHIEGIFDTLKSLIVLDLSSNLLENLNSEIFKNSKELRYLVLSKNKLKFLNAEALDPLVKLEAIDLCFNQLPVINKRILKHNKKLYKILLCNNRIEAIDKKFLLNSKKNLDLILLRGNLCINDDVTLTNGTLSDNEENKLNVCYENFNQKK